MKPAIFLIIFLLSFSIHANTHWSSYGGAPGGGHYSSLKQINTQNVDHLQQAWIYHTGDVGYGKDGNRPTTFETTPIIYRDKLIFCTPYNRVVALNPGTGQNIWRFDPKLDHTMIPAESSYICRGVAKWTATKSSTCKHRIFTATISGELIALNADTGKVCRQFGNNGRVDFKKDVRKPIPFTDKQTKALGVPAGHATNYFRREERGQGGMSSPPVVINDKVIVGSAFDDNFLANMPDGVVRAYDVYTGKLLWTWDPIPTSLREKTGAANVWSIMSVDAKHNLIYASTTSASPDFFGGDRLPQIPYSTSIVALNASTGKPVWHFQLVHHNIFDYDAPSQPTLTTITHNGHNIPVVVEVTKMGMVYIFNRYTGKPIYPITEKAVPQTDVPGERTSATQPFTTLPKPFINTIITPKKAWGMVFFDKLWCANKIKHSRSDGMFTPPSVRGSIEFPFIGGGMNWGSVSIEPHSHIAIVNYSRIASIVTLVPRKEASTANYKNTTASAWGSPYALHHTYFVSPLGIPCTPPPWGVIAAIDLDSGHVRWQHPFGSVERFGFDSPSQWGSPNFAGSLVTAGDLIVIGATMDRKIRAFNLWNGHLLWQTKLPAMAAANPMTYEYKGQQYIVIAAGGGLGSKPNMMGDSLVAFSLSNSQH